MQIMTISLIGKASPYTKFIAPPVAPVIACCNCLHWRPREDGNFGECVSVFMADMMYARWDANSPIMTAWNFEEPKGFEVRE